MHILPPARFEETVAAANLATQSNPRFSVPQILHAAALGELISATTTKTGLTVRCQLDTGQYPSGIVVSDAEMAAINIQCAEFHGEWNYTISPHPRRPNRVFIS